MPTTLLCWKWWITRLLSLTIFTETYTPSQRGDQWRVQPKQYTFMHTPHFENQNLATSSLIIVVKLNKYPNLGLTFKHQTTLVRSC